MVDKNITVVIDAEDRASDTIQNVGAGIGGLQKQMLAVGAAFAAVGAATGLAARSFVQSASEMEQQRVAFETLTGSVETGRKTFQDLVSFAAQTPFEIPQILEQSKRLLAMGTNASDLIDTFRMLGDVASGVGMEKLPQIVLAFGQIQATGRLMGTELRQLTEAGFNLADAMGVTNQELVEMVSNGEVSFEDVKNAFMGVTAEGGRFFGMMEQQAGTTAGKISNFNDNVYKLKATLGEALLPALNSILEALLPLIQSFANFAKEHPLLIQLFVAFGLALGVLGGIMLTLLPVVIALQTGLFTLMLPLLAIGVAIAALIAVGAILMSHWQQIAAFAMQVWQTVATTILGYLEQIKTIFITVWTSIQEWFVMFWTNLTQNIFFQLFMNFITLIYNLLMIAVEVFRLAWEVISLIVQTVMYVIMAIVNSVMSYINGYLSAVLTTIRTIFMNNWNSIRDHLTSVLNVMKTVVQTVWNAISSIVMAILNLLGAYIKQKIDESTENVRIGVSAMKAIFQTLVGAINTVISAFNAMAEAARNALSAAREAVSSAGANIKGKLGFQHGGVIPGSFNQEVPAILHGGERVVPRTGVDVNSGSSGGGTVVNVVIEGDVHSMDTVEMIVQAVKESLGRDNELAQLGVSL